MNEAPAPPTPPPLPSPAIDDERLREIVRIVRAALDAAKAETPRSGYIARCVGFLVANWPFTAFIASLALLALAWWLYDTSPLYWAKQIHSADLELDRKVAKVDFDREVSDRWRLLGEKLLTSGRRPTPRKRSRKVSNSIRRACRRPSA